jgi:hypothetical protein
MSVVRGGVPATATAAAASFAAAAVAAASLGLPATAAARSLNGDWEAHGAGGAVASFAIAGVSGRNAVEDLVVQAPVKCSNAFSTPLPIDTEVVPGSVAIGSGNRFASAPIKRRHSGTQITARWRGGKFALAYRHVTRTTNPYEGSAEVCDTGTIHLTARRGHRRSLKNGIWQGHSATSEPIELSVVAGGRALEAPTGPGPGGAREYAFQLASASGSDACAYQVTSPLFVAANGAFSNAATRLGDEAVLSGRFTRARRAAGEFSNLAEGCSQERWSAGWSFTAR